MEDEKKKNSEETLEHEEEPREGDEIEDEELFSDDEEFGEEEGDTWEQIRLWFQDNLRVILSVLIVALIAVGIYNYSKKPQEQQIAGDQQGVEVQQPDQQKAQPEQPQTGVQVQNENDNKGDVVVKGGGQQKPGDQQKAQPENQGQPQPTNSVQKSDQGYTVVAERGDGVTHLARMAVKDYLKDNADDSLTKEHKIYIEDYLRKHVGQGKLRVGDNRTFSDSLMKDAIAQAKQLNAAQLRNLQKYSARVSNL